MKSSSKIASYLFIITLLIIYSCNKDESPTAPQNHLPKIESLTANPTTVLINTETTLTCVATDEDKDNLTITWSSKRGTFPNGVVGISVKWVAPSTAGTDTINVTVNDGKQLITGKLEIIVGTISSSPTLLAPIHNANEISLTPTLSWNSVSNATSYTLQVSTINSFSTFVFNQSGLTNTSHQISGLNSNTTYYWRVNSTNTYGTSSYSSVFSFKTVAPPTAPTLITPANNAIDILLTPTLSWNALGNATSYTLQVSINSSFSSFVFNQSNISGTSQQVSGLNYFTKYYWRVNASNSYGTSAWSSTWAFTAIGIAPQAPILSTPVNNVYNIALAPTLNWNTSNTASSYTLQVSTNSSFTNFIINQSGLATINRSISGLSNWTKYYWRVNAINSYGTSSWSETWSFTTQLGEPKLTLPNDREISIPIAPILSWSEVNGAMRYSLAVSTNSSFTNFIYYQNGLTNSSQQITGLNNFTTYYWRVKAINDYGESYWSTYRTFLTLSGPCQGISKVTYAGKTYNTVQIETQCWLKENLDVGSMIQGNQNANNNETTEKYCYNNDLTNCNIYGGLYQWEEAMQYLAKEKAQGICPSGWHIPSFAEFQALKTVLNNDGNVLKAVGQGIGNGAGTNTSGFTALLAGRRADNSGYFYLGVETILWSSTENGANAKFMFLSNLQSTIDFYDFDKDNGYSIRCIKD